MAEDYQQAAFEVKTMCDDLARTVLRWHWEEKNRKSFQKLLSHVQERQKESPEYYDRMPDPSGKKSWQELDTTFCTRVLLDPEKDAAHPQYLLGDARSARAARAAINSLRKARNAAAHASTQATAAESCGLFAEAVDALEEAYQETVFSAQTIRKYAKSAQRCLDLCNGKRPAAAPKEAAASKPAATVKKAASGTKTQKPAGSSGKAAASGAKAKTTRRKGRAKQQKAGDLQIALIAAALLFVAVALLLRAKELGYL